MSATSKKKVVLASAGGYHTLALCDNNELYAWGNGMHGECGFGEFLESNKPRLVKFTKEGTNNENEENEYNFSGIRSE